MSYKIAVLDIGKTNKKLYIYDQDLNCLNPDAEGQSFETTSWQTPSGQVLECDDMAKIYRWMVEGLRECESRYGNIRVISVSTHGATLALLGERENQVFDGDGGLVFPIISYESEVREETHRTFFERINMSPEEAQRTTGTPDLSWLLNGAKQVHFLQQHAPERFDSVTDILMFPQYVGYLLTGNMGCEPTYLGCHSYLLDASGDCYSEVAQRLGITRMLPDLPPSNTWDRLGTIQPELARQTGLDEDCVVSLGVHDSNAALVPYLAKGLDEFVVQDSGTWVVTMSPRRDGTVEFEPDELGLEVFFNRDIYGNPVKTTIFRGGAEFDFYRTNVLSDRKRPDGIQKDIIEELIVSREAFVLPTIDRGAGLFPESVARMLATDIIFRDAATAWHAVDLGIAVQGWQGLRMAAGENARKVYVEGNIGQNNPVYRSVIAGLFPDAQVRYGSMGGAPFGAAILGAAAAERTQPETLNNRYEIELNSTEDLPVDHSDLRAYATTFLDRIG